MSKHQTVAELESIRRCVEWAVPQLNCGNMTKDGYWAYLVLMFGQISPDAFARELAEMLRVATSERDHLKYMERSYPNIWRELVHEVISGDFTDAAYAAELPSRLAESGWFKRARAALT
jgi:hypothetical protein